ncbi:mevalonate kinase [Monomorium pharaonis]|uniref:mevalonate kinase n=1 Tax=Monomorium pharaonis TaxID=307658 RepID=UPI00063FA98C|nr:mevalonate kinase [Monomorium pharaonis]
MIEFKVSAPGKVILYGEHAVVYGKTAVAASLNLRTTVKFAELPKLDSGDIIKLEFPNVKLSLNLPLNIFLDYFFSDNFNYPSVKDNNQLYAYVNKFLNAIENVIDKDNNDSFIKQQMLSLQAFFYLLVYIAYEEHIDIKETSFHVHLSTELNIGSGLGSSASFAVSLAACFLHWSLLRKGGHDTFNYNELDKISRYALNCERIMHESPSGIDNNVCTYGSVIKFKEKKLTDMLPHVSNLKILLVNTNVTRSTKEQVKKLVELKDSYPTIVVPILDSIDALSNDAWETLKEISNKAENCTKIMEQEWYKILSNLIHINQGLLNALGVSHPRLEMICAMAKMHSYAAKLTGAGGGGYAYILLPPDIETESINSLSKELEEKDFYATTTSLGGSGVKIEH